MGSKGYSNALTKAWAARPLGFKAAEMKMFVSIITFTVLLPSGGFQ